VVQHLMLDLSPRSGAYHAARGVKLGLVHDDTDDCRVENDNVEILSCSFLWLSAVTI
jgi:hypothetical protein